MNYMDYIQILFKGTNRQGPGTDAATLKALSYIKIPSNGKILDIGCGTGAQTMVLLKNTSASITALDVFQGFLDTLYQTSTAAGFKGRLKTLRGDMNTLDLPDVKFDAIWSEGAIYIMGFENGLKEWKKYLKSGGYLVVSDAVFIKPDLPAELVRYWNNAYGGMGTAGSNREAAVRQGYEVVADFQLGRQGWVDFYGPLKKNLEEFSKKYRNGDALQLIQDTKDEFDIYEKYSEYYDYVFYILRKP